MNPIERLRLFSQRFRKESPHILQETPIEETFRKRVPISDSDHWILGEATGFHYLDLLTSEEAKEKGIELDAPALVFPTDEMGDAENQVFFRRGPLKMENSDPTKEEGIYFNRGPLERNCLGTTEELVHWANFAHNLNFLFPRGGTLHWPDALSHWQVLIEPTGQTVMDEIDGYTNEANLVGVRSFCAVDRKDIEAGVVVSMEGWHFPICGLEEHPDFEAWTLYPFRTEDGEVTFFKSPDQITRDNIPPEEPQ